jgi:hypothetical protein
MLSEHSNLVHLAAQSFNITVVGNPPGNRYLLAVRPAIDLRNQLVAPSTQGTYFSHLTFFHPINSRGGGVVNALDLNERMRSCDLIPSGAQVRTLSAAQRLVSFSCRCRLY